MSAQPQEQPRRQRAAPAPGKGPASAPVSPFRQPGALSTTPQSVELPPGYRATLDPPVKSDGFLGDSFTLDSQEFLVWLSDYFADDMVTMRLTIRLMGMASPGGEVEVTQQKLAELLTKGAKTRKRRRSAHRPGEAAEQPAREDDGRRVLQSQVSRSLKLLSELGVIVKLKPGLYQIHPRLSLRGGSVPIKAKPGTRTRGSMKVDQLSLLDHLEADEQLPKVFRYLRKLPDPANKPLREDKARQQAREERKGTS